MDKIIKQFRQLKTNEGQLRQAIAADTFRLQIAWGDVGFYDRHRATGEDILAANLQRQGALLLSLLTCGLSHRRVLKMVKQLEAA